MVSKTSQRHIEKLADAAHGITAPFVVGGECSLNQTIKIQFAKGPGVEVRPSSSTYEQTRQDVELLKMLAPAKFGRGRKTLRDSRVREGLQLYAKNKAFSLEGLNLDSVGILETIQRKLLPGGTTLKAELYSLNLYPRAGHFRPHKDTPRQGSMIGTLVVCLPSQFSGGQLTVVHRGATRVFNWGAEIRDDPDPKKIRWAAFFGDVDHAIERVWDGHRLTATWLLRQSTEPAPMKVTKGEEVFVRTLSHALALKSFLVPGGVLAFPCFHMYSSDKAWVGWNKALTATQAKRLKGRDQIIARSALSLGLGLRLVPTLIENCADETWQLERFPSEKELRKLSGRVDPYKLEKHLPLIENEGQGRHPLIWVYLPPRFNRAPKLYIEGQSAAPIFEDIPALEHLTESDYSSTGYFGNEGGAVDFYLYAALHVTVPPAKNRAEIKAQRGKVKKSKKTQRRKGD